MEYHQENCLGQELEANCVTNRALLVSSDFERFFSFMKFIKWDRRSRLSQRSLNSILSIRLLANPFSEFAEKYVDKCIDGWYNREGRRFNQPKIKEYKKRESKLRKRLRLDIEKDLFEDSTSGESNDDSD